MCVDQEHGQHLDSNGGLHAGEGSMNTLRVDVVDSWHKCWPNVLKEIEQQGRRERLMVDADGWLSARQCLLVAFNRDNAVAGHLVFSIQPMSGAADVSRVPIEAHQDDLGVRVGFSDDEVRRLLVDAATRQAKSLRCRRLVNFG
jgi:hypothetical protein